jgi:catechol 2,3-dioxygenase-like lactoylglutathione lyase family enzyme
VLFIRTYGQQIQRPPVWGIAKMTFLVSDFELARDYYGKFLGFDEAFSYQSEQGKVLSFKINDRQFLEFIEDSLAKEKNRLVSVSLETDSVEQMRLYLQSQGVKVSPVISLDGAGNKTFLVYDPSGIPVEFIHYLSGSLHKQSEGRYLSEKRISKRLHHAGLFTKNVKENDQFYKTILGFKEMWRYDENDKAAINFIYLHIPDCIENIEYFVADKPDVNHPCFLVEDMQETIYTLKGRQGNQKVGKPIIGKGNRWLLNMQNADGTKVEFTEAHTVR